MRMSVAIAKEYPWIFNDRPGFGSGDVVTCDREIPTCKNKRVRSAVILTYIARMFHGEIILYVRSEIERAIRGLVLR